MKKLEFDEFFKDKNMSWCNEFCILLKRNMINFARIPITSFLNFVAITVQALIAVLMYQNINGTRTGVQDRRRVG